MDSFLFKKFSPTFLPKKYPKKFPSMAAREIVNSNVKMDTLNLPVEQSNPAEKSKVSPGKKNPKNIPFSINITVRIKINPPVCINFSGSIMC